MTTSRREAPGARNALPRGGSAADLKDGRSTLSRNRSKKQSASDTFLPKAHPLENIVALHGLPTEFVSRLNLSRLSRRRRSEYLSDVGDTARNVCSDLDATLGRLEGSSRAETTVASPTPGRRRVLERSAYATLA